MLTTIFFFSCQCCVEQEAFCMSDCFHGLTIGMVNWGLKRIFSWKTKSVFALNINKLQIYLSTRWFVTLCLYKRVSYHWAFLSSSFHFFFLLTWQYSIRVYRAKKAESILKMGKELKKKKIYYYTKGIMATLWINNIKEMILYWPLWS